MQSGRRPVAAKYWVYVIELEPTACKGRQNCMYVGSSAKDPASRLAQHRKRKMFSGKVAHYAVRLRYDLMPHYPFSSRARAEAEEKQVAGKLRQQGYSVIQG